MAAQVISSVFMVCWLRDSQKNLQPRIISEYQRNIAVGYFALLSRSFASCVVFRLRFDRCIWFTRGVANFSTSCRPG